MTLTRYNELMDRVEVTPEMRERVLANAAEAAAQPPKRRGVWKPWVLAAACLALVLLGSLTLPRLVSRQNTPAPSDTAGADTALAQGGWERTEYDSAAALSAAEGFAVRDVPALFEAAEEKTYALIGGELAELNYTLEGVSWCFRVSPGSEDNSGDYNEYADVQTVDVGGVPVTLKGDGAVCSLALWKAGGFSYSLSCDGGVPRAEMEACVASALTG